jgi:hypothetical protein
VPACPDDGNDWLHVDDSCYYFSSQFEKLTWHHAEVICQSQRSHLVEVDSEQENKVLIRHLYETVAGKN